MVHHNDDSHSQNTQHTRKHNLQKGKLILVLVTALVLAVSSLTPALAKDVFPDVIPLPNGFQPEGIATGYGPTFFAGSIPTGAIYQGSLRTGEGSILVPPQEGRAAIGLDFDPRTGYLYVAGGPTGQAYVYDTRTGETVAVFQLAAPDGVFINDVIVTRDAAYFTDSFQPYIYHVPLGPGGIPSEGEFHVIELTGDFTLVPGFNANGITATPNGKWLIVVHSSLGVLYRVDPNTGVAYEIDLGGGSVPFGDGILLQGHTLYVVQNRLNQIAVVELSPDFSSGMIVDTILSDNFRVPTTVAGFGRYLYAVNARFGTPPTPETEYEVVQVVR